MSDAIHTDPIITPAMAMEMQLCSLEVELEQIERCISRPSDFALIRQHRDALYRIARLASQAVQKIDAREWAGREFAR